MTLEEQIANAIMTAFDDLGGDPLQAVKLAKEQVTVEGWVQQETAKIALAGGAEMIIPGLHSLTIPAGITYLLHKMATISWGIAALNNALVVETSEYSDLRNILTLWAEGSYYNATILDYQAIPIDTLAYAVTEEGYQKLTSDVSTIESAQNDVTIRSKQTLLSIVNAYAGDERSFKMVEAIAGYATARQIQQAAEVRGIQSASDREGNFTPSRRISARLATRLAARIGMRIPAKMVVGWIPLAGAVVNAFLNAQTLRGMSEAAIRYYERPFKREHLNQ